MQPKVSVIVPVYNVEDYLERCIDSLCNQTLKDIEIILVDDGSTDSSGQLCNQYAKKDCRIIVIHKKNAGQGIARNVGIEISKGKYISFLDSDDYIEKHTCENVSKAMEEAEADICSFGYVKQNSLGHIFYHSALERVTYEEKEIANSFVLHFFGDDPNDKKMSGVSACMTMFTREIIHNYNIRFLSERKVLSEDTLFSLDYCRHVKKAVVLPDEFYHYCQKDDSFSKSYKPERLQQTVQFCDILQNYADDYGIKNIIKNRIRMVLWVTIMECIKQEMNLVNENGVIKTYKIIREICVKDETINLVHNILADGMNIKQKLFLFSIKHKCIFLVMISGYFRAKRGL